MTSINKTFCDKALNYFINLKAPKNLPSGIKIMNPYLNNETKNVTEKFFIKYFKDNKKRILAFGINPGRFGGGVTGISFTDPVALANFCGIENKFEKRKELSSEFIYLFISEYGGAAKFYSKYFLSALYPLALIKDNKNYNFYDDKKIFKLLKPAIVNSIKTHLEFGCKDEKVICLGRRNYFYLDEINKEYNFFKKTTVLDHPRYIMQYRRKLLRQYLDEYLNAFKY
jgi:hypothetical protein